MPAVAAPRQRSFDDLGTPLADVTFCVLDIETTGGSPIDEAITEVGAVKMRGGECLGTFSTLVDPGRAIPPFITALTGITTAMVQPAPRIDAVLPSFQEFAVGTVLVGHNVRFDLSFLDAALERTGRTRLTGNHHVVDTCALARRLVRDEVRNCKLSTLADHFRLPRRPTHRALADALATADLLHSLLERAGRLGVLGLDDLLTLPKIVGHPQAAKLRLTERLPRGPGVYLFKDAGGRILYIGKATNLRSRVRSYFSGDDRRKIGALLRETAAVDHVPTAGTLEAAVLEVRLIHRHLPRFNRQATTWRRYAYLKLTLNERFPRLSVARTAKDDGALYLGPLPSSSVAKRVAEAVESVVPLRRCTARPSAKSPRASPCAAAQLGVATCPCAGAISEDDYAAIVEQAVRGLTLEPERLLDPLARKMEALADAERFEEAADARDRAAALAGALARQRRLDGLRRAGRVVLDVPGTGAAELAHGRLVRVRRRLAEAEAELPLEHADELPALPPPAGPLAPSEVDEVACVARWLDESAAKVRLISCDGELASPVAVLPRFDPAPTRRTLRR